MGTPIRSEKGADKPPVAPPEPPKGPAPLPQAPPQGMDNQQLQARVGGPEGPVRDHDRPEAPVIMQDTPQAPIQSEKEEAKQTAMTPAQRAERKARLATILDRGFVQDRLTVELPPDVHGEWVRNDPLEIQR